MAIHKEDQATLDRFSKANNGARYETKTNGEGRVIWFTAIVQRITNLEPLSGLASLTQLFLQNNQIADLAPLSGLASLNQLYLRFNQIADLAPLSGLSSLTSLGLSSNQIADLAPLSGLPSLTQLFLDSNQIADLAPLSGLPSLTHLNLINNQIANLAPLSGLSSLNDLGLSSNQIADLAPLSGLSSLTDLGLSSNQIADLAPLSGLSSLAQLFLSSNQIADLAPLSGLEHLKTLDLSHNPLTDLRPLTKPMSQMAGLYYGDFDLRDGLFLNKVKTQIPPTDIVQQGKDAVLTWFDAIMEEDEIQQLNQVKVMLIGDGAAGKTSLVQRIKSGTFDPKQNQTNGISIVPWTLEHSGDPIEVKFWDFGGQEIMHATHQFFMTQRCLYVVVHNAREKDGTVYWLDHIKSFAPEARILVVVNKIDVNPGFSLDQEQLKRDYPNIINFHYTSCSTGEGVEGVVASLREELPRIDLVRGYWLTRWFAVKEALEAIDKPYIKMDSYLDVCEKKGITNPKHQDILLRYLNDLGVMLWFEHHQMQDFQVLNPEWATNGVYAIITSDLLARKNGHLDQADLREILPTSDDPMLNYDPGCFNYLIGLMLKFELCFRLKEDASTILIPSLLEKNSPKDFALGDEVLHFVMGYSFLPPSLLPRLIVRLHGDLDEVWRTGMILDDPLGDARAVIVARNEEKTIEIKVSGQRRRDYFTTLRYFLHTINKTFDGVVVKENIIPEGRNRLDGISYKTLIMAEKEGIQRLPHQDTFYSVPELLGGLRISVSSKEELVELFTEKAIEVQAKRPAEQTEDLVSGMIILNVPLLGLKIDVGKTIKAIKHSIEKRRNKK